MVHRRTRVERMNFKDLPNGSVYYVASDNTGPFVKCGRATIMAANTPPTGATWTPTAVSDVSIIVKKVSKFSLRSQRAV